MTKKFHDAWRCLWHDLRQWSANQNGQDAISRASAVRKARTALAVWRLKHMVTSAVHAAKGRLYHLDPVFFFVNRFWGRRPDGIAMNKALYIEYI